MGRCRMPRSSTQGWTNRHRRLSAKAVRERIEKRDAECLPHIRRCMAEGMSSGATARALNAFGIPSPGAGLGYGGAWSKTAVERVLARNNGKGGKK